MFDSLVFNTTQKILKSPDATMDHDDAMALVDRFLSHPMDVVVCAGKIREKYRGNDLSTCGIVNAKSGHCSQDCAFCVQSSHHKTQVKTYPLMTADAMVKHAKQLKTDGARRFSMVASGKALTRQELETVCIAARKIREEVGLAVCGSLGMLTLDHARLLKDSGVTRYHHNLETAESFFPEICTTHEYVEDIKTVRIATEAGLDVCIGGIMGLGESWEQRVELALTLRELDVDSVPLNFLNPISGTKLADQPMLSPMEALGCIALFRFLLPQKEILVCGGREKVLRDFQSWIFMAGASGFMVGNYLTTEGRSAADDQWLLENLYPRTRPIHEKDRP